MLRACFRTSLLLICCGLVVGPQLFLQMGAWGWMLASYSQESSFEQAVRETFSGERPCDMCRAIEKTSENQPDPSKGENPRNSEIRLLVTDIPPLLIGVQPSTEARPIPEIDVPESLRGSVPTPPPRNEV